MNLHKSSGLLLTTIVSIYLMSCFQSKNKGAENYNKALEISTQLIDEATLQQYCSLKERSRQLIGAETVKVWIKNADKVQSLTSVTHANIDSCFENANKL